MLTTLVFPPQWIPTQPYLSIPSLTAFLKAHHCDVEQMDINVSFYDDLLSKQSLAACYEKAFSQFQELDSRKELPIDLQHHYTILSSSVLFGDYILNEVDAAKNLLRNREGFYEVDELFRAFKILELGLRLASSAYYPTNLTFHSYDMEYSCRSSKAVLQALNDREQNLFLEYFAENTVPKILEHDPGLLGISIINTSQLIPGLTLANLIKKTNKEVHINIGGSVFTRLIDELLLHKGLFSVFDSVIVHDGETALLNLIQHLNGEIDITEVPNLMYRDGPEIRVNEIYSEGEDMNALPAPCFDGFPLEMYFSPELILPVLSSRGCYWKRCTFCDHGYGYSGSYRPRNIDLLFKDLAALKDTYKTSFFTFQDEGISPNLISRLSDKIIEHNLDISWLADSRFESTFSPQLSRKIAEAGCTMLYLGLESANERILRCMDKGIRKENVRDICTYCTDAGIWTHLFLIFGFPTETRDEAKETMEFVLHNSKTIRSVAFGSFQLTKHSKVYENPVYFHVDKIVQDESIDLSLWYDYEIGQGMSKKETDEVIQEFYHALSRQYRDFPIWSNLDREHLFLYITRYKSSTRMVPDLSRLLERMQDKRNHGTKPSIMERADNTIYPSLREGVFAGRFHFNLAKIIHGTLRGEVMENTMQREQTNVVFDTNINRIFTLTDFGKDTLDLSKGEVSLSEIIDVIKEKHHLTDTEAGVKCKQFLNELLERNIVSG